MAKAVSEAFTLNNAWKNIGAQAIADGYVGNMVAKQVTILNFNATVAYVHAHTSGGSSNPSTAADGFPISSDTTNSPSPAITYENVDINTLWVHTAGNQTIKYQVIGQ